ncbi:MAG TPA: hypothetical protein VEL79_09815 [Vicinamibacterales bacterium]|nr:hypothetical protein [Vicinamibacterales bacterium]
MKVKRRLGILSALLVLPSLGVAQVGAPQVKRETYKRAVIDSAGRLAITASNGRTIIVPKQGEQSSFGDPIVSPAQTAVGAQANFPNCCTSYDIPLQLVVYAHGKIHRFTGIDLPIFEWQFADGGTRVAFGQEPVHFGCSIHYELRDIQSERRIASADIPEPCGQDSDPTIPAIPRWVAALRSARRH